MRNGLPWIVGIFLLGTSPLAAQSVTAPVARGIVLETRNTSRDASRPGNDREATQPASRPITLPDVLGPPAKGEGGSPVRQVAQWEELPPAPRNFPEAVEPSPLVTSPLGAPSVTAPMARGIVLEPRIAPHDASGPRNIREATQPASRPITLPDVVGPPVKREGRGPVRQVAQWEGFPPAPRNFPEAGEPPPLVAPLLEQPSMVDLATQDGANALRFWARHEYLLWRVRNMSLPNPLVTSGDPRDAIPGAIDQTGTRTLLGDSGVSYGAVSGARVTIGGWINQDRNIGLEGSGFLTQHKTSTFYATSGSSGSPLLALPFFNRTPGFEGESAVALSSPANPNGAVRIGSVQVSSSMHLWGAEVNSLYCLWSNPGCEVVLLSGFRFAELKESLHLASTSNDFSTNPSTFSVLNDHFDTRNRFYGPQFGLRLSWQRERWTLDATGKAALGVTHQTIEIRGDTARTGPVNLVLPYGFFTEPSNRGDYLSNQLGVIPAAEVRLGYQLTRRLGVSVGYDGIFWNQVARPGNQIDRNINLSQNQNPSFLAGGSNPGGAAAGAMVPVFPFNRTDFWAHGVSFGVEYHY